MVKTSTRVALSLPIGVMLAILAWTGTLLYWHFRIRAVVRAESLGNSWSGGVDEWQFLERAGCRALPYLVDSLTESRNQFYLMNATHRIATEIAHGYPGGTIPYDVLDGWIVDSVDSGTGLRRKVYAIQSYWREHGRRHHQWWRVWSGRCATVQNPNGS